MTITNNHQKPLGLYLHIPFCIQKCNYCDFLSFGDADNHRQTAYISALRREIEHYGARCNNKYYVDTLFVGGGTPSILKENLIRDLLQSVKDNFPIQSGAEITIESNPKTLNENKLNTYLELGFNRLSIGAQSFHDQLLNSLGRAHNEQDFFENYKLARKCGFGNINIDLMFAIPGQTFNLWKDTIERTVELGPEHLSFYGLQIEEGTPFYRMMKDGSLKAADEELDREMYRFALLTLKDTGYSHYEISNAAKEGFACRHNLKYWSMDDYLGLGLGAHSFVNGIRFSNETDLDRYILADSFTTWQHENTREDNISEFLFTGLRKIRGIDLKEFENRFGQRLEEIYAENWNQIQKYLEDEYLMITEDRMCFSLKGIDISNTILTEFLL